AFAELKALTGLKTLRLHTRPITDDGIRVIGSLTGLEELVIGRSVASGMEKALPQLLKLTKLRLLGLNGSDLTDEGLKQLTALKDLTEVWISATKTTPDGHAAFKKALPRVKVVTTPSYLLDD